MSQYTNKQVRDLLVEFFADDEEELEFFCDDHYSVVKEKFSEGMSFKKRAHTLTQHCAATDSFDQLLALLKETDSEKFKALGLSESQPQISTVEEPSATPEQEAVDEPDETEVPPPSDVPISEGPSEKPIGNPEVFISYSRKDEIDFIKPLYQKLTSNGISVWYDRHDIGAGKLWQEAIAEGISNCKVFLLSISPDSMVSDPVRREITLAHSEHKDILPLMWRKTDFPNVNKYQLAGLQYINFEETASDENFNKVITAIKKMLGQEATLAEVTENEPMIAPEIGAVPQSVKDARGAKKRKLLAVQHMRRAVVSSLIVPMDLERKTKERYIDELGWLFTAADHLLQVQRGEKSPTDPVPVDIPNQAKKRSTTNKLLPDELDELSLKMTGNKVEGIVKQINIYIKNLDTEIGKLAKLGAASEDDPDVPLRLKNSIASQRIAIAKRTNELADLMDEFYGIRVNAPQELLDEVDIF